MNNSKILNKYYAILIMFLVGISQLDAHESFSSEPLEDCKCTLTGRHYSIHSTDVAMINTLIKPKFTKPCKKITSLHYEDFQYALAVSEKYNQDHYFHFENWNRYKIKGDGGVDVTGAPRNILVEGANNTHVNTVPGGQLGLSIAIPAEGYVTFDLSNIGSSNIIFVNINGNREQVTSTDYFSPLLKAGDLFALEITSEQSPFNIYTLNSFEFLTNATGVIKRQWIAEASNGEKGTFAQFIALQRASIANLILPKDMDGVEAPMLRNGASTNPSNTGFPLFDQDGDLTTTFDQIRLDENEYGFSMNWVDEIKVLEGQKMIIRHWTINDKFFGNQMQQKQVIKLSSPYQGSLNGKSKLETAYVPSRKRGTNKYQVQLDFFRQNLGNAEWKSKELNDYQTILKICSGILL